MTIAWVFPGQGSQKLGMADSLNSLAGAKERFQYASNLIGRDLFSICTKSDNSVSKSSGHDLNDTRNTQPALFIVESLLIDQLKKQGRQPSLLAGHSLGEIVALYAAEVFDWEVALNLLHSRSELMASSKIGGMTAVLGFDRAQLEELVASNEGVVIANDNSAGQVVLSGEVEALKAITSELICKRAIPLAVSGAFHSPFMQGASTAFAKELDKIHFKKAIVPVISNSDPSPTCDQTLLKDRLKQQMTTGVRWRETMNIFSQNGIKTLVEIGPGNVLSGLAKRTLSDVTITQISTSSDLGM